MAKTILVVAKPVVDIARLTDEEDREVPGTYAVEVPEQADDTLACSIALDVFHSTVAVGVLDEFEFTVIDPATGKELVEDDNDLAYAHAKQGVFVGKVAHVFLRALP